MSKRILTLLWIHFCFVQSLNYEAYHKSNNAQNGNDGILSRNGPSEEEHQNFFRAVGEKWTSFRRYADWTLQDPPMFEDSPAACSVAAISFASTTRSHINLDETQLALRHRRRVRRSNPTNGPNWCASERMFSHAIDEPQAARVVATYAACPSLDVKEITGKIDDNGIKNIRREKHMYASIESNQQRLFFLDNGERERTCRRAQFKHMCVDSLQGTKNNKRGLMERLYVCKEDHVAAVSNAYVTSSGAWSGCVISRNVSRSETDGVVGSFLSYPPLGQAPRSDLGAVVHLNAIATAGRTVYPCSFGHFPGNVLPRLMRLVDTLPPQIPIYWPKGIVCDRFLSVLRRIGAIKPRDRPFLREERHYFARTVYFTPHWESASDFQLLREKLTAGLHDTRNLPIEKRTILVLSREDATKRRVRNHAALLIALQSKFSKSGGVIIKRDDGDPISLPPLEVVSWTAKGGEERLSDKFRVSRSSSSAKSHTKKLDDWFVKTAEPWNRALVVLSPHGAGLHNMFFCRPDAAIVELAYPGNPSNPSTQITESQRNGRYSSDSIALADKVNLNPTKDDSLRRNRTWYPPNDPGMKMGFPMPDVYYRKARLLFNDYWLTWGESGDYAKTDLIVDVEKVVRVVESALLRAVRRSAIIEEGKRRSDSEPF